MTEDDIDKLFNRSKEKNKNDTQPQDIWGQYFPQRDFASVKFLKVDEPNDKLLNGLPKETELVDDRINALFDDQDDD